MNRRRLVVSIPVMLFSILHAHRARALTRVAGSASREFQSDEDDIFLRISVGDFLCEDHAETERRRIARIAQTPFENHGLEESASISDIGLPDDLRAMPGSLTSRLTFSGVAAVEFATFIGTLRRGSVFWKITVWGNDTRDELVLVLDVMRDVMDRGIASTILDQNPDGEATGGLWDLLPSSRDLPDGYTFSHEDSPSPEIEFPEERGIP